MTLWFFRILAVIVGPVIGWYEISQDWKGILIGVAAALFIIAVEIIIDRVPLSHLVYGMVGAVIGFTVAFLITQAILLMNDARLSEVMRKYTP